MRIEKIAAEAGIPVRWRPFNVRVIFVEQNNIPLKDKPVEAQYMWRDIERRAALFGVDWRGIPPYPVDRSGLSNRVGFIAAEEGWAAEFTKAAYPAWFLAYQDFGLPEVVGPISNESGQDPDTVMRRADSDEAKKKLDFNTAEARKLGVFGAPSFVVNVSCSGDMTVLTMQ